MICTECMTHGPGKDHSNPACQYASPQVTPASTPDPAIKLVIGADDQFWLEITTLSGMDRSEKVYFGDVAEMLDRDGRRWVAFVDVDDESDEVSPVTEYWVYEARGVEDEGVKVEVRDDEPLIHPFDVPPMVPAIPTIQEDKKEQEKQNGTDADDENTSK